MFSSDEGSYAFTFARLGYVTVFAHEVGHHLQNKSGITGKYYEAYRKADAKERLKLTRRSELQADCFAGVILRYLSTSIKLTDHDQVEIRQWFYDNGDEDVAAGLAPDHGSSTAQIYWLERGLKDANFEDCNTWTAKSSRVK